MNPLRNKAVEQKTLSSPLRMAGRHQAACLRVEPQLLEMAFSRVGASAHGQN
jgi:hypothetical protein